MHAVYLRSELFVKFLKKSYACVVFGSVCALLTGTSHAQSINPYPVGQEKAQKHQSEYEAFQPDQAVIAELLARQAERKKRARSAPVNLAGKPMKIYKTREEALRAKEEQRKDVFHDAAKNSKPFSQFQEKQNYKKPEPVEYKDPEKPTKYQPWEKVQAEPIASEPSQGNDAQKPFSQFESEKTSSLPDTVAEKHKPKPAGIVRKQVIPITQWSKNIKKKDKPKPDFNQPDWSVQDQPDNKQAKATISQPAQVVKHDPLPAPHTEAKHLSRNKVIPTREPSKQPTRKNISPFYGLSPDEINRLVEADGGAVNVPQNSDAQEASKAPERVARIVAKEKASSVSTDQVADVEKEVDTLDQQAKPIPAFVHEQAIKRGLQAQAGRVVPSYKHGIDDLAESIYQEEVLLETKKQELETAEVQNSLVDEIDNGGAADEDAVIETSEMLLTQNFPGIPVSDMGTEAVVAQNPDMQASSLELCRRRMSLFLTQPKESNGMGKRASGMEKGTKRL